MKDNKDSYNQIMKATSIFGGVQVFQIIIQILRSKIVAILLGPTGIGINGLYNSTIHLITGFTNFGLATSAVKNVAAASGTGNTREVATVVIVLRRVVWLTGILGTVVMILMSRWLSQLTFKSDTYTWGIIWVSITLLINQLTVGQTVILRGMRKIKLMAQSSLTGSILGLFISLPIYYFWGLNGIVPAIIATSVINMVRTWWYARKIPIDCISVSLKDTVTIGKDMLIMGLMLSLSSLLKTASDYGVKAFISNTGSLEQVGLYTAGIVIMSRYVDLIFQAMSTDYYPRLSSVAHDNKLAAETINQQAEIGLLLIAPIICIFLVFINIVIRLLYSNKFLPISSMIQWGILGMLFKVLSFSIAFLFLSKGNSKLFLFSETTGNIVFFVVNIAGYYFFGLTGMGISFLIGYTVYCFLVYLISRKKYDFRLSKALLKVFISQIFFVFICFAVTQYFENILHYIFGSFLIVGSSVFSLYELNRRMNLKQAFVKVKNRFVK